VTSGRREQSSPSLSTLCGHPRHCRATPGTATTSPTLLDRMGTGPRHTRHCTSYGPPLTSPSSRPVSGGRTTSLCAATLEVAPVRAQDTPRRPNRTKIRQDGHQLCGTVRHASTRRRIVRHACNLLSPWPIKGRVIPQPQGGDDGERSHTRFPPSPRYWHLPQSIPLVLGGPASSPATLVAPLYEHHGATQYSAPSTPLLDVRPRPEPG
jgi:hypothetical protein